jgi:hypothetical protein
MTGRLPDRDAEILRLDDQGVGPTAIAARIHASRFYVWTRLKAHGRAGFPPDGADAMWKMTETRRRAAFARRAAEGARKTLDGK